MDIPFIEDGNDSRVGPDYVQDHPGVAIPYLTITGIASVGGTVGNILVICAVLMEKKLHTMANMFIINLAIADLCVTAVVDPFSIVGMVKGEAWFDNKPALCEFAAWSCLVSCFCSLLSIGAIAFNRYIYICRNHLYDKIYTFRNTLAMCIGLWVVSVLAEMPNFLGWGDHAYDNKALSCIWDRTADLSYNIFFAVVGVACPIIIIIICYGLMFRHIRNSLPTVRSLLAVGQMAGSKHERMLYKQVKQQLIMFFACFVVFTFCWAPYTSIVALDYKDVFPIEAHLFCILIAHVNSSLNCIVYGVSNVNFRNAFYYLLGLHYCFSSVSGKSKVVQKGPEMDNEKSYPEIDKFLLSSDTKNVRGMKKV